ncbi:MAG: TlpA family protein disulfide reductase [Planctomycetia bacterium]|nr:TlpA family protein disulfide reductase [Planctomycetia bacterium]
MIDRVPRIIRLLAMPCLLVAAAFAATIAPVSGRQPAAPAGPAAARPSGMPKVPPLPQGTPEQLLAFVEGLRNTDARPNSREEMMNYMREVSAVSVQAADAILGTAKPSDAVHEKAARLKLESLMMLGRLGDDQANESLGAFARTLVDSPSPELAKEARRLVLASEAQEVFSSEKLDGAAAVIEKTTAMLAADPDDTQTAGLALQLAGTFEQVPGGDGHARAAYEAFGPILAKSSDERVKSMAESFAGTLRRLSLPGHPMVIKGTLMNGQPFDQKTLAGKVVLVDFWATWCGPCVAEIPNVLEQYEKYHSRGFEVIGVSLDEDREALEAFISERKIPWPILFEKSEGEGWRHPLSTYYGIRGIPTVILIGRDGNVITLDARGEKLGERLDALFKDAG